ncbi:hypothetical protein CLV51_11098 [Chitinophaga niastensis]|uniref:Uncharacterized protein n=1 Tax=Chitinophaga niastensis TaxID=536980 RepID=A0A2P8H9K8_CHINA|nr:hypothetical protein [Chitinophaga niastensis]PSL42881.1 hypothetical protein CLV51_11098 [Chitinophaga niastensis]
MKAASISEIKKELNSIPPAELAALCIRLAKYKVDNKELLNYLLFEAHDEQRYIESVKSEIDKGFADIGSDKLYNAKKRLRKILRITNKHIRYTSSKQVEAELLIYFCTKMKDAGLLSTYSIQLHNLYEQQLKKITKVIAVQHEDLQYDYQRQLDRLLPAK